jgi:hypothetical protein
MELASAPTLLILALLVGVLAAAVMVGFAALRRGEPGRRQSEGIGKVVVGPTLLDGVWCRLVAYEDGYRRVEVLGPSGWTPSHRDVSHLMQAIPGRSMGDGKKG